MLAFISWNVFVCEELSVNSTVQPSRIETTLQGSRLKSDRLLLKNIKFSIKIRTFSHSLSCSPFKGLWREVDETVCPYLKPITLPRSYSWLSKILQNSLASNTSLETRMCIIQRWIQVVNYRAFTLIIRHDIIGTSCGYCVTLECR